MQKINGVVSCLAIVTTELSENNYDYDDDDEI